MNNKERLKQKFNKRKHSKTLKGIAFILVFAILISSAYAFLTAHQTKNNVFTLGNIKLELHEDGWESNQSLTDIVKDGTKYKNGKDYISSSKLKNVVPDEPITKDPTILNVGSNPADVYISVDMCTALIDGEYVDIFETNYDSNTSKWKLYKTENGNHGRHIYYYSYDETLYPTEETDTLFSTVTLKSELYDLLDTSTDYTIVVNGFGIQQGAEPSIDEIPFPLPEKLYVSYIREDGSLYAKEEKEPGDPIEMKFDASLAKQNFSFDWIEDDGTVAFEGMPMPNHNINLNANYTKLTDATTDEGLLKYKILKKNNEFFARVIGINDEYYNNEEIINVPESIWFVFNGTENSFTRYTNAPVTLEVDLSNFTEGDSYCVPVTESDSFWYEYNSIKTVVLPDIINYISGQSNQSIIDNHTENINLPFALSEDAYINNYLFSYMHALDSLKIPETATNWTGAFLYDTHVNTLTIPQSVRNFSVNANTHGNTVIYNNDFDLSTIYFGDFTNYILNGTINGQLHFGCKNKNSVNIEINGNLYSPSEYSTMSFEQDPNNVNIKLNGYALKLASGSPDRNISFSLSGSGTVDYLYSSQWNPVYESQGYNMTIHGFDTSAFTGTINNQEIKYFG